jgi:hypothetical protein
MREARVHRAVRSLVITGLAVFGAAGCVRRSIFVRTEPEGAKVFLDGTYLGTSPRKIPFEFYGTREIAVRAEGRAPGRVLLDVDPPWYEYTPIDFVSELLLPATIEDERQVFIVLPPAAPPDLARIRGEAEAARAAVSSGGGR